MRYLIPFLFAAIACADPIPLVFTWEDASDNETGFKIYASQDGTTWGLLADIQETDLESWDFTGEADPGDHWDFYITSYNATDESDPSNVATFDVPPVDETALELTLTWDDNADNEDGFKVYTRTNLKVPFELLETIPTPDTESFVYATSGVPGEVFEFVVSAYNVFEGTGQESMLSNIATYTVPEPPPENPGTPAGPTSATLTVEFP